MDKELQEAEAELTKWPHRTLFTPQYLSEWKGIQRALHELDMATMELQASKARRRTAANQLDKARKGCLGIDATDLVEV